MINGEDNMKKILLIIAISLLLAGCSEEVSEEKSEIVKKEVIESEEKQVLIDDTQSVENIEQVVSEESEEIIENSQLIEDDNTKETGSESVMKDNNVNVTSSEENLSNETPKQAMTVYEQFITTVSSEEFDQTNTMPKIELLEENIIQLPLQVDNKGIVEVVKNDVTLNMLVEQEILEIAENPLTVGFILAFDMKKLFEVYPANSYSVMTSDEELGIMISMEEPTTGVLVIEKVVSREDLNSYKVNMMN